MSVVRGEYTNGTGEMSLPSTMQDLVAKLVQERLLKVESEHVETLRRMKVMEVRTNELSSFLYYMSKYHPAIVDEWINVRKATRRVLGEEVKS